MSYATQAKLETAAGGAARFLALTDWNSDQQPDADRIADAQRGAESWIDSFIPAQYSPPMASPSDELVDLAAEETVYRLKLKRDGVSQHDVDAHNARQEYLLLIRAGKVRPDALVATKSGSVRGAIVPLDDCGTSRKGLKGVW